VALAGGERGQERRPRGGGGRVGLLQAPQARGLGLIRQLGGVRGGEVPQRGARHVHRLAGAGEGRGCAHRVTSLRGWQGWSGQVSRFSVRSYRAPVTFPGTYTPGHEIVTKELKGCRGAPVTHAPPNAENPLPGRAS